MFLSARPLRVHGRTRYSPMDGQGGQRREQVVESDARCQSRDVHRLTLNRHYSRAVGFLWRESSYFHDRKAGTPLKYIEWEGDNEELEQRYVYPNEPTLEENWPPKEELEKDFPEHYGKYWDDSSIEFSQEANNGN